MESNYNNENFEQLLRESSDQYRMYPSESVWKNVFNALHTRRRWFGIGFILLLSAGFVTTIMLTNSAVGSHQIADRKIRGASVQEVAANTEAEKILLVPSAENMSIVTGNDKIELFQSQPLPGDDSYNRLTDITDPITSTPAANVWADGRNTIISIPGILNANVANYATGPDKLYAPVTLVISDATTDQDGWMWKNGRLPNNEITTKKSPYSIQTAYRPLTIESVINSYTRRNKKLSFQFYFTPTISYRKLSENKSYLRSGSSSNNTSIYNNINNAVTHKPDMGIELGVAARYAIGKKIKLRTGLQFNTSRYDIKAFSYAAEITTIALNTGNYTADSVNTISSYRNFNGYKSDWLHNFYFQISAPVGIEWKLAGDDKIQFGIASTIQPTYILGDRAYLLSSNYKNYAEVPSLMRRWNMNASFEAFVSYSTGKMNWQVGPQIRYQLQSSFVKEYPVKENLFDFGLKIGVSANR
ncbi:MAG: hypothetical protein JWM28_2302 [Chitinophagaceae bacterium]|nr:hypothetical protein [Chitinophagaceae bacterium]